MRFIPVLLVAVALATSAGCFGKDDESGGDTPTPTTPTGTGTTTPTGATPTTTPTSPTTGGNTTTPTKPAPKEVFADAPTFQNAPAPDPNNPTGITSPTQTKPFPVTAGYTKLTLNVTWAFSSAAPGGVSSGITIAIQDAAGATIATCAGPGQGPQPSVPGPCSAEGAIPALAADYNAVYTGSGTFTATVSVVAS